MNRWAIMVANDRRLAAGITQGKLGDLAFKVQYFLRAVLPGFTQVEKCAYCPGRERLFGRTITCRITRLAPVAASD
jgi:hypothetical protein